MALLPTVAAILVAFFLGFLLSRAHACTFAAVERAFARRRADWIGGLGIVVGWSAFLLLGLSALWQESVDLPAFAAVRWPVVLGGVLLGAGARLNGGCFLGSISLLGRGNLNTAGMLVGVGAALALLSSEVSLLLPVRPLDETRVTTMSNPWLAGMALASAVVVATVFRAAVSPASLRLPLRGELPPILALPLVGLAGGMLFALHPNWSYSTLIDRIAHLEFARLSLAEGGSAVAVFLGAGTGAVLQQRFELQLPKLVPFSTSLGGGLLMGLGAGLVPGSNDVLLLWTIPGLALHGLVAIVVMAGTIWLLLAFPRRPRRRRPRLTTS
jgi:uncharacterized membrane protein YedE/YeeE